MAIPTLEGYKSHLLVSTRKIVKNVTNALICNQIQFCIHICQFLQARNLSFEIEYYVNFYQLCSMVELSVQELQLQFPRFNGLAQSSYLYNGIPYTCEDSLYILFQFKKA